MNVCFWLKPGQDRAVCFGSPYGKSWFIGEKAGRLGTEMREIAEPIVQTIDEHFIENRFTSLMSRLSKAENGRNR